MELSPQLIMLVPVVLGLTQVFKIAGISKRWIPLMSVFLGIVGVSLLAGFQGSQIIQGTFIGLTACGLWSGPKAVLGK